MKFRTTIISSEGSGCNSTKFCTSVNFPPYGIIIVYVCCSKVALCSGYPIFSTYTRFSACTLKKKLGTGPGNEVSSKVHGTLHLSWLDDITENQHYTFDCSTIQLNISTQVIQYSYPQINYNIVQSTNKFALSPLLNLN